MVQKEKWAEVIKDFHESQLPDIIERDIEIPLEIPLKRAISIIGPRRVGKTYEMFWIIKKLLGRAEKQQILYVNFERADLGILSEKDLVVMLEAFYEIYPENKKRKVWLFLDEVQNVSSWEKFVRTSIDSDIQVFISGSSSKLLSKDIATSMRGRSLTYTIFPFSFKEYLRAKGIQFGKFLSSAQKAAVLNALKEYIEYGGYPEAVIYSREREKILNDIRETAIYRDVIERYKIRNIRLMKLLVNALINSSEFSVHKFYNFLKSAGIKTGKNVLYNYVNYLSDVFFVFMLRKFSYSYKEAEQSIPKPYFVDNGLLRISGIQDSGRLMENLVFVELLRRNIEVSYFKASTREEVDFVIRDNKRVIELIQVCYNLGDMVTKEREFKSLIKASKELKCRRLLVITRDYEGRESLKGVNIKIVPLWKWLLER